MDVFYKLSLYNLKRNSCHDVIFVDGKVLDLYRQDMLYRYIQQFDKAIADDVTQKRIPKDSAYWYKQVIETNGGCVQ